MKEYVASWCEKHPLVPLHVDCATTVMLKILDGKCKMKAEEKIVMALLYDLVRHLPGELFADDLHVLIDVARNNLSEAMRILSMNSGCWRRPCFRARS